MENNYEQQLKAKDQTIKTLREIRNQELWKQVKTEINLKECQKAMAKYEEQKDFMELQICELRTEVFEWKTLYQQELQNGKSKDAKLDMYLKQDAFMEMELKNEFEMDMLLDKEIEVQLDHALEIQKMYASILDDDIDPDVVRKNRVEL